MHDCFILLEVEEKYEELPHDRSIKRVLQYERLSVF